MAEFFSSEDRKEIVAAIAAAELNTSGEIRVHVVPRCKGEPVEAARRCFQRLDMAATEQRNGVLFFLAYKDHKFAVLGDTGIDAKVPEDFWQDVVDLMAAHFRAERFVEGLCEGIERAGIILKADFPYTVDDKDELPNEISYE